MIFYLVHKQMLSIRKNLRMLQHSNNFEMFILCNKMMHFNDFAVLVPYISIKFNKYEHLVVLI